MLARRERRGVRGRDGARQPLPPPCRGMRPSLARRRASLDEPVDVVLSRECSIARGGDGLGEVREPQPEGLAPLDWPLAFVRAVQLAPCRAPPDPTMRWSGATSEGSGVSCGWGCPEIRAFERVSNHLLASGGGMREAVERASEVHEAEKVEGSGLADRNVEIETFLGFRYGVGADLLTKQCLRVRQAKIFETDEGVRGEHPFFALRADVMAAEIHGHEQRGRYGGAERRAGHTRDAAALYSHPSPCLGGHSLFQTGSSQLIRQYPG